MTIKTTKGQALLPLLIVIVIVLTIGTASIELAISNVVINRYFQEGLTGYFTVEAALENAFLRILRNPGYTGENLQINQASCTIEVSGMSPKIVSARCDTGRQIRKMQAEITYNQGIMTVGNIKEVE
ncbi:MAG TPA: hypothetical protein VMW41_01965 [Candidatus Bathyarchaeia archaeon]|nr:hypothetical protein [Candidatus Bathyarchaeia archaeon]